MKMKGISSEELAPIVVFCYDRCRELERMLCSLQANNLAKESDLYIFCDGPKSGTDLHKTVEVREYVKSISGFKSISIDESPANRGLAPSIISGVSKILEKYDRVIVVEDDLILSNNFLAWMNGALNKYKNNDQVFSISGFCPSVIRRGEDFPFDGFFTKKAHSWGWATWKDR